MTGHPGGRKVEIQSCEILDQAFFRLELTSSCDEDLPPFQPGQFLMLSLKANGRWTSRPYTITSNPQAIDTREVLIRVFPDGQIGSLLLQPEKIHEVRIGSPMGLGFSVLSRRRPAALLLGGIGVTTGIAALHATIHGKLPPPARITLSLNTELPDFEASFRQLARQAKVPCQVHYSKILGRLGQEQFLPLSSEQPRKEWYLCGPSSFVVSMREQLMECGVSGSRIHEDRFTSSLRENDPPPARRRTISEKRWSHVGITLALLWVVQAMILPKIALLQDLQERNDWRLATGSLLLLGVCLQWLLAAARSLGFFSQSRRIAHWHRATGAVAPVGLYLHSSTFGFGILGILTGVYVANTILGACDKSVISGQCDQVRWHQFWLPAHIVLSISTSFLVLWHLYLVLFFHS